MGVENTSDKKTSKVSIWSDFRGFAIIAILVILFWLGSYFVMIRIFEHPDHAGPAGDLFGAATSLFSGLAFAGLISTLLMQRKELELQREQLELQNDELKLTRGELEATRDEFQIQRFESRFFGMIKLVNDHVELMVEIGAKGIKGRKVFVIFASQLGSQLGPILRSSNTRSQINLEQHKNIFERIYILNEAELGTYFRLLYNLFRQLESQQCITDNEKKTYAAIIRAQLSSGETLLLMLNGISDLGIKFQDLIKRYALLEHLPEEYKMKYQTIIDFYGPSAFGDRAHLFFDNIKEPDA